MPGISASPVSDANPLVACQLPSWYPHHEHHSLKSIIVPLPREFLLYLQEDGIFLPDDSAAVPHLDRIDAALLTEGDYRRDDWDQSRPTDRTAAGAAPQTAPTPSGPLQGARGDLLSGSPQSSGLRLSTSGEGVRGALDAGNLAAGSGSHRVDDDGSSEAEGHERPADWTARFPELRAAVDTAIASLGGRAVPKLNWSCPTDALWVSATGSLACRNAEQVVLLLKSSDRTAHDATLLLAAPPPLATPEENAGEPRSAAARPATAPAPTDPTSEAQDEQSRGVRSPASPSCSTQQQPEAVRPLQFTGSASGCATAEIGDRDGAVGAAVPTPTSAPAADSAAEAVMEASSAPTAADERGRTVEDRAAAAGPGPGSEALGGAPPALRPVLVLKKWYNLRPEREFRCFVREGRLVAASQRDVSQAFPALTATGVLGDVRRRLWRFWEDKLRGTLPLRHFVYDVYVPSDSPSSVWLVDVNPLADTTSPLLFDWAELGFGPAAVRSAQALLQHALLPTGRLGQVQGGQQGPGEPSSAETRGSAELGAAEPDDSWIDEAAELSALPLPNRADELQIRIVETEAGGTRGSGAEAGGADGDAGGGLGALLGPMRLGARAAMGMPYDMLGIADSVDKMIEMMERQQQQRHARGRAGAADGHDSDASGSSDEDVSQDDDDEEEDDPGLAERTARQGRDADGADQVPAQELAAFFGGPVGSTEHGLGDAVPEHDWQAGPVELMADAAPAEMAAEMAALMGGMDEPGLPGDSMGLLGD